MLGSLSDGVGRKLGYSFGAWFVLRRKGSEEGELDLVEHFELGNV